MKSIFKIALLLLTVQFWGQSTRNNSKINLTGNWEYIGFGKAITVSDSIVKRYHLTSKGNVLYSKNSTKNYFDYFKVDIISNDTIRLIDGVKTFKLFRSNKDFEKNINKDLENDPKYNFEILWNTFNEQYVYFKERKIDWKDIYNKYEPQVNSKTTSIELYILFEKMLKEINDSHVSIDLPESLEDEYNAIKENTTASKINNNVTGEFKRKVRNKIIQRYLNKPKNFNKGSINYGKINNDIGYLEIQNMVTMAYYSHIPDTLSSKEFFNKFIETLFSHKNEHDEVREGTRFMMDSIMNDIGNVKSFIIDLRFNGGGFDDASVEVLNHFTTNKTDFSTKKVRLGNGYSEKQIMSLYPSKNKFTGKVYILTSYQTASAAEILVLGAKELPNSKIIGSTTEGVFSDILHKRLPNGWKFGLSNMIYETMAGVSYENIGIEPDYKLNYPKNSNDFYKYLYEDIKDGDDAIEKIIELTQTE